MMKKEIDCSVVQDLLPNYIEKLTSEATNLIIEDHLKTCGSCRETYNQMVTEVVEVDKAPKAELRFLKKVKKTRLLAAVLTVILTLAGSYLLYAREFQYSMDKADLSNAITEYLAPFDKGIDAYALETKEMDGMLFVTFKDQNHESINGIARFIKGLNNRYRILGTRTESSRYSSVVQPYVMEYEEEWLVAVSGYNLSSEIASYGLVYSAYTIPETLTDFRVERPLRFDKPNLQFLEFYHAEELVAQIAASEGKDLYYYNISDISFYDEAGNEITDKFRIAEDEVQDEGSTTAVGEPNVFYFFIAIVMGFGVIMTRYFLTE
jgi:hypothetical protein